MVRLPWNPPPALSAHQPNASTLPCRTRSWCQLPHRPAIVRVGRGRLQDQGQPPAPPPLHTQRLAPLPSLPYPLLRAQVWNYKLRRCMFTLLGHLDYIRTVHFHSDSPWIVSASDDQTIRVWNWISRTCITVLTGHNHYVMSAAFHPKDDLVVSASLDQTVRVWDVSGLKRKSSGPRYPADGQPRPDLFGASDAVVKYVLEGHDRGELASSCPLLLIQAPCHPGVFFASPVADTTVAIAGVNWAAFHPSLPLIVSGADDRQVKLWRMNDTKAWEVDTLRGHVNNVSCVLFHPRQELIISNSEDKSIRVWDMSKRTAIATFRREHDRFWVMTAHPNQNLLAAGHDSGMIVYKLERERPAMAVHDGSIYYVKDKDVRSFNMDSGAEAAVVHLRRRDTNAPPPRSLSYNPADSGVLVCSNMDGGTYELYASDKSGGGGSGDGYRGQGLAAVFVARNRFAVLDKQHQILVKDLRNETSKQIAPPHPTADYLFPATPGCCLIRSEEKITLFDVQQRKSMGELATPLVKFVVWSSDMSRVALLSKHAIIIANRKLDHVCTVHETIRIKSGAWDSTGIFVYTTLNHIKYCLPNGDNGIIKTLEHPIYLASVSKDFVTCLDRDGLVRKVVIDSTEMVFKLKLVEKKYAEVISMIRTAKLCGQAIIGYLQQKGFPEIALHFVGDDKVKFGLALESSNIDVAMECAMKMDDADCWSQLADVALRNGNVDVVEKCYQRTKNFERLSFLYLITGQTEKLRKMLKIAESRNDMMGQFSNALFLGDVGERFNMLRTANQDTLALITACNHGLDEQAVELSEQMAVDMDELLYPEGTLLAPPAPILEAAGSWPLLEMESGYGLNPLANPSSMFDVADDVSGEPLDDEMDGGWGDGDDALDTGLGDGVDDEDAEAGSDDGWDLGDGDIDMSAMTPADSGDAGYYVPPSAGESSGEKWAKLSQLAAEHVAGGSFESAMLLLREQLGITNFKPLKGVFLSVYAAAHAQLPTLPSLAPYSISLANANGRPMLCISVKSLTARVKVGYQHFQKGKFLEVEKSFRQILQSIPLVVVDTRQQVAEVKEMINICREYITASRLQMESKAQPPARKAEMAALCAHCKLQAPHLVLALRVAMQALVHKEVNNFQDAASICRRLLELNPAPALAQKAKTILQACDKNPRNETKIDYDSRNPFVICAISLKPIFKGNPVLTCGLSGSSYMPKYKGEQCPTTLLTTVGVESSGLNCVRI
eukprot:COSAG01_NODE_1772_length_9263_cov_93.070930_3_plen_1231_part_00